MPEAFASVDRCPYLAARTGEIAMITTFLLILFSVNFLWPFYRFIIGNIVLFRSHKLLWLDIRFWAHVTSMETKQFTVFRNRASRGRRRMGCKGARALQFWQFSHGYLTWRFLWNFFRGVDNFRVFFLSGKFIQWWRPCSACHCVVISSSRYVSTINLSFTLEKIG